MCDRRTFVKGLSAIAATGLASARNAQAQSYRLMCSYAGGQLGSGLAPATQSALQEIRSIENALGYYANLDVYQGGVPNASATVINNRFAVIYNPEFLGRLARCHRVAPITVLAHEVGHHANADTQWIGQFRHSYGRELGADFVSGVAMRRLGISLDLAQSGIMCSFGPFSPGNASHPNSQMRLQAIARGWQQG